MNRTESNGSCAVCHAEASQICGGCGEISYCSKEHQKEHWLVHKSLCKPYKIVHDEKFGRCIFASKNLKPGEIIFGETAVITGPKQGCTPCCLKCYASLDRVQEASLFRCPNCNFPFCQEQCAKSPEHEAECLVLSRAKSCIVINDVHQMHPVYQCITPLRGLLLKTTQPKLFNEYKILENHNDLRRQSDMWRIYQVNVVQFLRKICGLADGFSEEEIHASCGVIDVNAFEIRLPGNQYQQVLGVFPLASMMSHNCVANTQHVIDANYTMTVRASVPIIKGEQIFTSYTLPLEGTKERRAVLRQSKLFECDCSRCSDPTECLTYLSALRCPNCSNGVVLPERPLDEPETNWQCSQCPYKLTAAVVTQVIDKLKEELETIEPDQVEKLEDFFSRHASLLHPNHFLLTRARQSLSTLYGRNERFLLNTMTSQQLERKVDICRRLLSVADIVEPGLTRIRGVTMYEMYAPLLLLAQRSFEESQCKILSHFKKQIEIVRDILSESIEILSLQDPASTGGIVSAVEAMEQIQRWISTM
ncbi:SET domain-containing protein SmydA-8-like [Daphnia pulicaria]|uniref:SET domain-containing protein SmydA-8-like n=1 Tax=Daphnia pulicaria TaxID=35523 RepID=UPI001EEAE402|nr:SET domain-containing protein SmydA-8-like [Daphnia pulicaria]